MMTSLQAPDWDMYLFGRVLFMYDTIGTQAFPAADQHAACPGRPTSSPDRARVSSTYRTGPPEGSPSHEQPLATRWSPSVAGRRGP